MWTLWTWWTGLAKLVNVHRVHLAKGQINNKIRDNNMLTLTPQKTPQKFRFWNKSEDPLVSIVCEFEMKENAFQRFFKGPFDLQSPGLSSFSGAVGQKYRINVWKRETEDSAAKKIESVIMSIFYENGLHDITVDKNCEITCQLSICKNKSWLNY